MIYRLRTTGKGSWNRSSPTSKFSSFPEKRRTRRDTMVQNSLTLGHLIINFAIRLGLSEQNNEHSRAREWRKQYKASGVNITRPISKWVSGASKRINRRVNGPVLTPDSWLFWTIVRGRRCIFFLLPVIHELPISFTFHRFFFISLAARPHRLDNGLPGFQFTALLHFILQPSHRDIPRPPSIFFFQVPL